MNKENRLERDFTGYIKIFRFKDPNMGSGEDKTISIQKVSIDNFSSKEKGFKPYHIKNEYKKRFGLTSMDFGYRFISLNEIKKIRKDNNKKIKHLKQINTQLENII